MINHCIRCVSGVEKCQLCWMGKKKMLQKNVSYRIHLEVGLKQKVLTSSICYDVYAREAYSPSTSPRYIVTRGLCISTLLFFVIHIHLKGLELTKHNEAQTSKKRLLCFSLL